MRKLLGRTVNYVVAFAIFLVLLQVVLGATGFSDKILESVVNEELRQTRQGLARTIRDPDELEDAVKAVEKELRALRGLDKAWYVRLPADTLNTLRFDFGTSRTMRSFSGSNQNSDIVLERIPITILLMTTSFVLTALFGLLAGVWAATHAGGRIDRMLSFFAIISSAIPAWWIGILAILVFAVKLGILPAGGMYSAPPPTETLPRFFDLLKHAILPVASLTLVSMGPYMYTIRAMTLKVTQQPFVSFAQARGFSPSRIRWRYILRVAAPPIVTGLVLGLVGSFSGAIITETVFNWPGMGRLYADAILGTLDEGLIVALTIIFAVMFMVARFLLDIIYIMLDPRIRK